MSGHSEAPSSRSLYLILISTFIFGFLTGGIVFLQNNTGGEGDGSPTPVSKGFEVLAYTYGGCEKLGCPSYRIAQDGLYTFFERGRENETLKIDGEISEGSLDTLKIEMADADYVQLKETSFTETCPIEIDTVAFRYDITYKGERYRFDSCVQDLGEAPLFSMLEDFFLQFEDEYNAKEN